MKQFLSLLLVLTMGIGLLLFLSGCDRPAEDGFEKPAQYASVIQVTINPTVNLYLDTNNVILAVEYVNSDAADTYQAIETKLVGANLESGMDLVIKTAVEKGYLAQNKEVKVDLVEAKETVAQTQVLKTAVTAIESTLAEKEIAGTVTAMTKGETVSKEELDRADTPADTTTTTAVGTTTSVTTTAVTTSTTTKKTTTKKGTTTTKKAAVNPQTALKKGVGYAGYKLKDGGILDEVVLQFQDDGMCQYAITSYSDIDEGFNQGTVEYNGTTYYAIGDLGGTMEYTLTSETVTLHGGKTLVFTMTEDGSLKVKENNGVFTDYQFLSGSLFIEKT